MSFALPSVKNKSYQAEEFDFDAGSFGVPETMTHGLTSARTTVDNCHSLMQSENNYQKNVEKMNMTILRNTQGLHAPLRIAMELKAAQKVGHLPCLKSSNAMLDSLTGRDLEIDPSDIYNTHEFLETIGSPHAMIEKSFKVL